MAKHKVHFFKVNLKDEKLDHGELFGEKCSEVYGQSVDEKTLKISSDDQLYRLTYFTGNSDHFEGKIVKYRNGTMTKGSIADDELEDLTLEDGERFAEVTHFIYTPATGILSFEYNQNGPRAGMFIRYINAMQKKINADAYIFVAEPLMHPDVLQKIEAARDIKMLSFSIPVSKIPTDFEKSNLFAGLLAAKNVGNPGQVSLTIKGSRGRGDKTPLMSASALMTNIREDTWNLGLFGTVSVTVANDFGTDTFNLLENKFEASKDWPKAITNEDSATWFADIVDLYQKNKDLLLRSVGLVEKE